MNPAELFQRETDTINLSSGDAVFREGESADRMFVILEGSVDIVIGGKVVETAEAGSLIGEMAMIDDSARSASAIVKTPCRLVAIDQRRFHFLIQQTPFFATHVMKVLARRLRNMDRLLFAQKAP